MELNIIDGLSSSSGSAGSREALVSESGGVKGLRKPTKTLAGVAPLAVMLPPRPCDHGTCTYCPSLDVPQSYTPLSPAVMRARLLNYSPEKQVLARLKAFEKMGHPTDKVELIIMGGTFLQYPEKFKHYFIKCCYDALNGCESKDLESAKKINETAKNRCVALCVETRPDNCDDRLVKQMLDFGTTRVEFGVQMPDDKIYELTNRGHSVKDVVSATRRVKDAGFKVGYHIMPGLPGATPDKDLSMFKEIFSDEDFKPDQLKLYPCQVMKGSDLENDFYEGKYKPYSEEEIVDILVEMVKCVPRYCRVMRMMRAIPPLYLVAGTKRLDLRSEVEKRLNKSPQDVKEIRFREIGFRKTEDYNINIKVSDYVSSGGKEFFIEAVNSEEILFGLLRLRFPGEISELLPELKDSAIVREIHVYGKALELGESSDNSGSSSESSVQHAGLGKELMRRAEAIAKSAGYKKLAVISGIGVREYYEKLGYHLDGYYMVKSL